MLIIKKSLLIILILALFLITSCQQEVGTKIQSSAEELSKSLESIELPEQSQEKIQDAEEAINALGDSAQLQSIILNETTTITLLANITTTTQKAYSPCKSISDGICPQLSTIKCTSENDYDCCANQGLCWVFADGKCISICSSDQTSTTTTTVANLTTTTTSTTLTNSAFFSIL